MIKRAVYYLILSAFFVVGTSYAQDSTETIVEVVEEERLDMPIIFFSKEQRRILEAVRQGVVASDTFEAEGFIPLVVIEEILPEEQLFGEVNKEDRKGFQVDAIVRNRTKGIDYIWIDGQVVEDIGDFREDGFRVGGVDENEGYIGEDFTVRGLDEYEKSKFEVKVGQSVNKDGYIDERLPVVIIHNKNQ